MINITIKQLRYFDALARALHFGRAAEMCSVTQPALSMQIQEFEASLGLSLLERTRSGVQLTPQGAEVARRAASILSDVRDLIDTAHTTAAILSGGLRLGVIPSLAPYLLPPLLPLLRDAHPDLELHVRETQTHALLQELSDGKLDVLLLALPVRHGDIETIEIFEDRFLLAMPPQAELSKPVLATPELVEQERLLLLEEGHCLRDQALTYCQLQQSQAINTFGASSLSTLVEMVSAGLGVTLLPEIAVPMEMRGRSLSLMRFEEPQPVRKLGLVWRTTSPRKKDFKQLAELVGEAGKATMARAVACLEATTPADSGAQGSKARARRSRKTASG